MSAVTQVADGPPRRAPLFVLLLAAVLHAPAVFAQEQELPKPVGKVNDFAEVLSVAERETLQTQLATLERETSAEMAVVTMRTLGGQSVEEYGTALFNAWGIGKKDRDNGVLILVAVEDRAMRIEVGYGLEGVLPDGLAGAVIRESFLPRFRDDAYREGILEGTARIVDIVRRSETLTPQQLAALDRAAAEAGKSWAMAGFIGIFVAIGAFLVGTGAGAKVAVQTVFGLVFAIGPLMLSSFVAPTAALVLLVVVAIGVVVIGYRLAQRPGWRRALRGKGGSGWVANGPSSSSSSSGGSSSGGSFGGGSSGGGGASGRW